MPRDSKRNQEVNLKERRDEISILNGAGFERLKNNHPKFANIVGFIRISNRERRLSVNTIANSEIYFRPCNEGFDIILMFGGEQVEMTFNLEQ